MKIFFPWLFYLALVGCGQSGLQSTELLVSSAGKSIMKPEGTGLYPVHVGDKMGYINVSGKLVIEPTFHRAESFSDGLAGVQSIWDPDKNVYDFIDVKGNVVLRGVNIPEMSAPKFSEGLVPVEQNGKTGFMNKEGKIVIRPQFYCEVSKGSCGCECEGGAITPFESGHSWVVKGHNHILIDRAGKQVIAFDPDHSEAFFGSGIVSILRDKRIVLIGAFGKRELDGEFEGVGKFSEGVCPVKVRREGRSDPVTIYIDESGNQALPGEFSLGSSFKEGFAIVRPVDNDSRSYLLDRSGKQIELPEHIEIRAEGFSHGLLRAEILTDRSESTSGPGSVSSNSWTETQEVWLDYKGRIVVRFQPSNHKKGLFGQRIESEFDGSLAYIYSQDKLGVSGYVDRQGKFVFIESPK